MSEKPKLLVEKMMDGEEKRPASLVFPHCDARILHLPADCEYCAGAAELQSERERLGVSNTGHTNRSWPCPADKARSSKSLNAWSGNRAQTKEEADRRASEWAEAINDLGIIPKG